MIRIPKSEYDKNPDMVYSIAKSKDVCIFDGDTDLFVLSIPRDIREHVEVGLRKGKGKWLCEMEYNCIIAHSSDRSKKMAVAKCFYYLYKEIEKTAGL